MLELKNESSDPQKGVVGLGGAVVSKKLTAFRIEPEKRLSLIVPVAFGGTNGETGEIRISCDSRISRCTVNLIYFRAFGNTPCNGMFSSAASYD